VWCGMCSSGVGCNVLCKISVVYHVGMRRNGIVHYNVERCCFKIGQDERESVLVFVLIGRFHVSL